MSKYFVTHVIVKIQSWLSLEIQLLLITFCFVLSTRHLITKIQELKQTIARLQM